MAHASGDDGAAVDWVDSPGPGAEVIRSHWMPYDVFQVCTNTSCEIEFDHDEKKHHCRCCGNVYCSRCTSYLLPLNPHSAMIEADGVLSKVCILCFERGFEEGVFSPRRSDSTQGRGALARPGSSRARKQSLDFDSDVDFRDVAFLRYDPGSQSFGTDSGRPAGRDVSTRRQRRAEQRNIRSSHGRFPLSGDSIRRECPDISSRPWEKQRREQQQVGAPWDQMEDATWEQSQDAPWEQPKGAEWEQPNEAPWEQPAGVQWDQSKASSAWEGPGVLYAGHGNQPWASTDSDALRSDEETDGAQHSWEQGQGDKAVPPWGGQRDTGEAETLNLEQKESDASDAASEKLMSRTSGTESVEESRTVSRSSTVHEGDSSSAQESVIVHDGILESVIGREGILETASDSGDALGRLSTMPVRPKLDLSFLELEDGPRPSTGSHYLSSGLPPLPVPAKGCKGEHLAAVDQNGADPEMGGTREADGGKEGLTPDLVAPLNFVPKPRGEVRMEDLLAKWEKGESYLDTMPPTPSPLPVAAGTIRSFPHNSYADTSLSSQQPSTEEEAMGMQSLQQVLPDYAGHGFFASDHDLKPPMLAESSLDKLRIQTESSIAGEELPRFKRDVQVQPGASNHILPLRPSTGDIRSSMAPGLSRDSSGAHTTQSDTVGLHSEDDVYDALNRLRRPLPDLSLLAELRGTAAGHAQGTRIHEKSGTAPALAPWELEEQAASQDTMNLDRSEGLEGVEAETPRRQRRQLSLFQWATGDVTQWLTTSVPFAPGRAGGYASTFEQLGVDGLGLIGMSSGHDALASMRPADIAAFEVARRKLVADETKRKEQSAPTPIRSGFLGRASDDATHHDRASYRTPKAGVSTGLIYRPESASLRGMTPLTLKRMSSANSTVSSTPVLSDTAAPSTQAVSPAPPPSAAAAPAPSDWLFGWGSFIHPTPPPKETSTRTTTVAPGPSASDQLSHLDNILQEALMNEYLHTRLIPVVSSPGIEEPLCHPHWTRQFVVLTAGSILCFSQATDLCPQYTIPLRLVDSVTCVSSSSTSRGLDKEFRDVFQVSSSNGMRLQFATRGQTKLQLWLGSIQEAITGALL